MRKTKTCSALVDLLVTAVLRYGIGGTKTTVKLEHFSFHQLACKPATHGAQSSKNERKAAGILPLVSPTGCP